MTARHSRTSWTFQWLLGLVAFVARSCMAISSGDGHKSDALSLPFERVVTFNEPLVKQEPKLAMVSPGGGVRFQYEKLFPYSVSTSFTTVSSEGTTSKTVSSTKSSQSTSSKAATTTTATTSPSKTTSTSTSKQASTSSAMKASTIVSSAAPQKRATSASHTTKTIVPAAAPAASHTMNTTTAAPLVRSESAAAGNPASADPQHKYIEKRTPHPLAIALAVGGSCVVVAGGCFLFEQRRLAQATQEGNAESDDETLTSERLPEDAYGVTIACIIRDLSHLSKESGSKYKATRVMRMLAALKLLVCNITLQTFILLCIAEFSSAKAVFDIRSAYNEFEQHMYAGHVKLTEHQNARGAEDRFFNASLFGSLSDETKEGACRIPFAQPYFLFALLLVWSILVVGEVRNASTLFSRLVLGTQPASSMAASTQRVGNDIDVIVSLTHGVKAFVAIFVVLPRLLMACFLLWLGCRWLSATNDFQNLALDTVGLEFILLLKDLLYRTLVPERVKRDTCRMHVSIQHEAVRPSPYSFLGTFVWGVVAVTWVYAYMFSLQKVLPGYRWDVHEVCVQWFDENYAKWH